jgi:hypothetical protein
VASNPKNAKIMNNENNIITKFSFLSEVISEEYFHSLFAELIKESQNLTEEKQIELLEILGEKFGKFYNINKLNENEKNFISNQLIKWTRFSDINRVSELIGLMFSFVNNRYYEFLRDSLKSEKIISDVKMEILESVAEFEKIIIR